MKKGKFKNQRNKLNKRKTKRKSRFSKRKTNKKYNHRRKKTHNKRGGSDQVSSSQPGTVTTEKKLITKNVYRILKEAKMCSVKCLLFIVEEREDDLSGIYHKIYFVDNEEGTHEELNEKYAGKEFPYEKTDDKVRGSTPHGCSIAGWGFESLSIESGTQPLYQGRTVGLLSPKIPAHLDVFSLSLPDDLKGGETGKYKGVKDDNFSINPIRLALHPETYPRKDSEEDEEGSRNLNETEMLKNQLRNLCIDGFCIEDGNVITINGLVGYKAGMVFRSKNGTVMASSNTSIMGKRLFRGTDIELYLVSLVDEDKPHGCEKVKELEYIFLEKSSRGETYELVGNAQGKVDIQSNLDKDYKSGMRGFDMDENKSSARKTMSILDHSRVCCFDTHPEYPLIITDTTEGKKDLLILRLDDDNKAFIMARGEIREEAAASRVSDSDWHFVDGSGD